MHALLILAYAVALAARAVNGSPLEARVAQTGDNNQLLWWCPFGYSPACCEPSPSPSPSPTTDLVIVNLTPKSCSTDMELIITHFLLSPLDSVMLLSKLGMVG